MYDGLLVRRRASKKTDLKSVVQDRIYKAIMWRSMNRQPANYLAGSAFQTLISSNQPLFPATPSSILDFVG